jgi:hypothetical protein
LMALAPPLPWPPFWSAAALAAASVGVDTTEDKRGGWGCGGAMEGAGGGGAGVEEDVTATGGGAGAGVASGSLTTPVTVSTTCLEQIESQE